MKAPPGSEGQSCDRAVRRVSKGYSGYNVPYTTRRAVEHAARWGVRLALENNARPPGEQLSEIQEALQALSDPALGTNIDFANYVTCNQDPIAAIKALTPWIIYVHAKDVLRTAAGWKSVSLGAGELPLNEIFAALDATGAQFLLCFEFPGEGDPDGAVARSKAWLRQA